MKTTYRLRLFSTTPPRTIEGTFDNIIASSFTYPAIVPDALLTIQVGSIDTYEHFGAGLDSFEITIIRDHRLADLRDALTMLDSISRQRAAQHLFHGISIASHNHLSSTYIPKAGLIHEFATNLSR